VAEASVGEGELLSGAEALAWLESLTVGKEEELRATAEAESQQRVDEILGRKRERPAVEAAPETPSVGVGEPAVGEAPSIGEPISEEAGPGAEEEVGAFFGWSAFGEQAMEVTDVTPTPEPSLVEEAAVEEEPGSPSGEDALAWLESLPPEREEELRSQIEAEEQPEGEFFGWSAFGDRPEEVVAEAPVPQAEGVAPEPEEVSEPSIEEPSRERESVEESPEQAVEVEEVEVASVEVSVEPEPGLAALEEETQLPPTEEAEPVAEEIVETGVEALAKPAEEVEEAAPGEEAEPETVAPEETALAEEAPEAPAPEVAVAEEEEALEKAADETAPAEEAPAATISEEVPVKEPSPPEEAVEAQEVDIDELRERVKQKRSDHVSRLALGRALWAAGEVDEAMEHYARLIKSSAKTDEVISDLEQYIEARPLEPRLLRTLGDAYMKFGELNRALEIFNRAMDLL
jgi:hypothetical protein